MDVGKKIDDGMSFLKEGECRSIAAKPSNKSCRKKRTFPDPQGKKRTLNKT